MIKSIRRSTLQKSSRFMSRWTKLRVNAILNGATRGSSRVGRMSLHIGVKKSRSGSSCPKGQERMVPSDAAAVITHLHEPMRYPKGCPRITAELMAQAEPADPTEWLPSGRAALISGLMSETIPRNCCTKPFSSYHLGLHYSSAASMAENLPAEMVLVDHDCGCVRRISQHRLNQPHVPRRNDLFDTNSDDELEGDGRRFEDETGFTSLNQNRPLIQSPEGCKRWDAASDGLPIDRPAGPAAAASFSPRVP